MKKITALILTLVMLFTFAGCASQSGSGKSSAFTVCVDELNYTKFKMVFDAYEQGHQDVEVTYEIIPDESTSNYTPEARKTAIERLRTALMSGSGPDLYIVSSSSGRENFLADINLSMSNGIFCDLLPLFEECGISLDSFVPQVVAAGNVDGKQYIMPLNYTLNCILTNDTTREIIGTDSFESASKTMQGILALSQIPDAFSKTGMGIMTYNTIATYYNPYYLASPALVDYASGSVSVDTPFARDILTNGLAAFNNLKNNYHNSTNVKMTLDEWTEYVQSDKYAIISNTLNEIVHEIALCEMVGVTPNIDALPTESGGACAMVLNYAAIRSNSENKQAACELLQILLSEEYQLKLMLNRNGLGWPVCKGVLSPMLESSVKEGDKAFGMNFWEETYKSGLSEDVISSFLDIEAGITDVRFMLPNEVNEILSDYYAGNRDLNSAVIEMQQYMEKSIWAAN